MAKVLDGTTSVGGTLGGCGGWPVLPYHGPPAAAGGVRENMAAALSLLAYLVILWLGTVLGLDGTWWD